VFRQAYSLVGYDQATSLTLHSGQWQTWSAAGQNDWLSAQRSSSQFC